MEATSMQLDWQAFAFEVHDTVPQLYRDRGWRPGFADAADRQRWRFAARARCRRPRTILAADYLARIPSFPAVRVRIAVLAEELRCDECTARRCMRDLEDAGLLVRAPFYGERFGEQRANLYLALDADGYWLGGDLVHKSQCLALIESLMRATGAYADGAADTLRAELDGLADKLDARGPDADLTGTPSQKCEPYSDALRSYADPPQHARAPGEAQRVEPAGAEDAAASSALEPDEEETLDGELALDHLRAELAFVRATKGRVGKRFGVDAALAVLSYLARVRYGGDLGLARHCVDRLLEAAHVQRPVGYVRRVLEQELGDPLTGEYARAAPRLELERVHRELALAKQRDDAAAVSRLEARRYELGVAMRGCG